MPQVPGSAMVRPHAFARLCARRFGVAVLTACVLGAAAVAARHWVPLPRSAAAPPRLPAAVAVDTAAATRGDVPVYVFGLGTVQPFRTVTVTSRVDGALQAVNFVEGQMVKPGDPLAQIDPRPYQAAYDQAVATRDKDVSRLGNAQQDLDRDVALAPQSFASRQTVDTQRALVVQLAAQVKGDQAAIDSARTQLSYTTITAPIAGRTGIRLVDAGNNLQAASATGIVVVSEIQPVAVMFTLPEAHLAEIRQEMAAGPLPVAALSRDGRTELDRGEVLVIDNQIDRTTGTIRLKASFPNREAALWPGGFVTVKLLRRIRHDALTIPSAAVQRGAGGMFAYVVKPDSTVELRPLETAEETGGATIVTAGLEPGERVTTSNAYRLRPGIRVAPAQSAAP